MFLPVFVMIALPLTAQQLYWPRDLRQAYQNQTRSNDGWPGKKYWQNTGRYDITVTALPPDRTIRGTEQITYINNSPDTLFGLVFNFIQNIHKPGVTRLGDASPDYLTDGVHVDRYTDNGTEEQWGHEDGGTLQFKRLSEPLLPHDSVRLSFEWHYEISLKSGREGMIDSTTYYLAYFYPRVAVYDDVAGWDDIEHNDALEFYNDFNNYTLQVKVPRNYLVWATGNLLNAPEVLQPKYLQRLQASGKTGQLVHIADSADLAGRQVTAQQDVNTWKFAYDDISDVALGLSDHYVWDASSVVVDASTGRRASVQAAYNDTAMDYHHMTDYEQSALTFLSGQWPGVPYPFPKMTVFQGYAGMEYPMMANDETYQNFEFSRFVAEHEISHTYFPFYMGIDETRYGFMDEGWATTFELLYNRTVMSRDSADDFYRQFRVNNWIEDNSAEEDLPIITPGDDIGGRGLGNNEYGKPSLAYLSVKDLLGDDLFRKCLHGFMERWHGKHPLPWDFFYSFNSISGKNLDWFWNAWFFSHDYIDLAVSNVQNRGGDWEVHLDNIGGFPVPVDLLVTYTDGSTVTVHRTPAIWEQDPARASIALGSKKSVRSVTLVHGIYVDADAANDTFEVK